MLSPRRPSSRHSTENHSDGIQSQDWPEEVSIPRSREIDDQIRFDGDGLDTGVRVMGSQIPKLSYDLTSDC